MHILQAEQAQYKNFEILRALQYAGSVSSVWAHPALLAALANDGLWP
jgi:hypothetical protein